MLSLIFPTQSRRIATYTYTNGVLFWRIVGIFLTFFVYVRDVRTVFLHRLVESLHTRITYLHDTVRSCMSSRCMLSVISLHRLVEFNFTESPSVSFLFVLDLQGVYVRTVFLHRLEDLSHTRITYTDDSLISHPQNWTVLRFIFSAQARGIGTPSHATWSLFYKIVVHIGGMWGQYFCTGSWNPYTPS